MTEPSSRTGPILLFDVMDTLVHDPFRDVMPAFFELDLAEMLAAKHPSAWVEFELGQRDETSFLASFFADGRPFDHEAFLAAITAGYRFLPGMEAILEALAAAGHEMHVLSNYPVWYRRVEARTGLSRYLPWTFVSTFVGYRKPDARVFEHVAKTLEVAIRDLCLIDDQKRNVDAARAIGMDAILFRGAGALREELVARRLL